MIAGITGGGVATERGSCRHACQQRLRAGRVRSERPAVEKPKAGADPSPPRAPRPPLEDIQRPPAPLPAPARAAAAARAFSAGNGYLTGLIVDRTL